VLLAAALYSLGTFLEQAMPALGTSGPQMLVWGFFISTITLYHGTFTVNSLAHRWGSRRYATSDDSRNNLLLALVTLGEGWHNNHHHYPGAARQGFFWWEIDLTYYGLLLLSKLGLIWDLRAVPEGTLARNRIEAAAIAGAK
jgi:stearoyl-CoA desaturase (delta-9 desaturase)